MPQRYLGRYLGSSRIPCYQLKALDHPKLSECKVESHHQSSLSGVIVVGVSSSSGTLDHHYRHCVEGSFVFGIISTSVQTATCLHHCPYKYAFSLGKHIFLWISHFIHLWCCNSCTLLCVFSCCPILFQAVCLEARIPAGVVGVIPSRPVPCNNEPL